MGLLDRLKKKAPAPEDTNQESISSPEVSEGSGGASEAGITEPPAEKKRFGWIKILLVILILGGGAGGGFYYFQIRVFQQAKKLGVRFFTILSKGENNRAYALMSRAYREEIPNKAFSDLIEGSAFLFEDVNLGKILIRRSDFDQTDTGTNLTGKLFYADGSSGKFQLALEEQDDSQYPYLISGFEINAPERKNRIYQSAYNSIQEFFKTIKVGSLEQFINFLHPSVQERLGKVEAAQLHRKLIELNFKSHQFDPKAFVVRRNVELVFSGNSLGANQREFRGSLTLFYHNRHWYILAIDFQPRA